MKRVGYLILLSTITLPASSNNISQHIENTLSKYQSYLEQGTHIGNDYSYFSRTPLSRYHTFKQAFMLFAEIKGTVVVELGTSRSFTHGGLPGCNQDNTVYWTPNNPENWDWGAGFFTRMAAECLAPVKPSIHTVDISAQHIKRCQHMTADYKDYIAYHVQSSLDFLNQQLPESIDLIYLDTGDMTPIEPTARLQLAEAKIIVEKNLLKPHGIILIDDVKNTTPQKFGELGNLGKSKYSIPYLISKGFIVIADEYQVMLRKEKS